MEQISPALFNEFLKNVSPEFWEHQLHNFTHDFSQLEESWQGLFIGLSGAQAEIESAVRRELSVFELINEIRSHGHRYARFNPFERRSASEIIKRLKAVPNNEKYMATQFAGLNGIPSQTLKNYLRWIYLERIGVELQHITEPKVRAWIEQKLHPSQMSKIETVEKKELLQHLLRATYFEEFLQKNYQGKKRFSLEGGESLVCALWSLAESAVDVDTKEISLAMSHRGRLNVLANFLKWPLLKLFAEFEELVSDTDYESSGDVKYHLGHSSDIYVKGKRLHISLAFNPSHLEYVYPVSLGKTKAKLQHRYDSKKNAILPVVIHGDAAVIGQGIVAETLNLSELKAYSVGGTIHFVINNQLGFTASASESRSTTYCTDFAKAIEAPIFHVEADDVESLVEVTRLAFEFRREFERDIFIDINCYRKHGHNETDEPRYTNPLLYKDIDRFKSVTEKYGEKLQSEKVISEDFSSGYLEAYQEELNNSYEKLKNESIAPLREIGKGEWIKFRPPSFERLLDSTNTPVTKKLLTHFIERIHQIPKQLDIMPKLERSLERRAKRVFENEKVDWALAELLSFASLLHDGFHIRLVGQDSVRGTFSQRHAAYVDQRTGERYFPLKTISKESRFDVFNSPLSENAALGFEFGYSLSAPHTLTLWEAQFGDFFNGAQVIVDQFIAASEAKWSMFSGLVLLLPHGHEGQGPEHSSARVERFLQLSAQGNIQVVIPSTAAQYFHLLRRQMHRGYRKPLVVFTPKSLLRSELNSSQLDCFQHGGFQNVIGQKSSGREIRGIVCCGKIYWELYTAARERDVLDQLLIIRVEQLYPLDMNALKNVVNGNPQITEWLWVQEEPQNCGAWSFIKLNTMSLNWSLKYVGRPVKATTAEGNPNMHHKNQAEIIEKSLRGLEKRG